MRQIFMESRQIDVMGKSYNFEVFGYFVFRELLMKGTYPKLVQEDGVQLFKHRPLAP